MTILYLLRFPRHLSVVKDRWKEVIMLMLKLSVKSFIFAVMMVMEALLNTAFCAQMEQSFNSNTLYVTGGSMWTVLLLNPCTL